MDGKYRSSTRHAAYVGFDVFCGYFVISCGLIRRTTINIEDRVLRYIWRVRYIATCGEYSMDGLILV